MVKCYASGPSIKFVRQIFRETTISNPPIRTRTCAYQGVRNVSFRKILRTYLMNDPLYVCLLNIIVAGGNLLSGPCTAQKVSRAAISDKNCETRTLCPLFNAGCKIAWSFLTSTLKYC